MSLVRFKKEEINQIMEIYSKKIEAVGPEVISFREIISDNVNAPALDMTKSDHNISLKGFS